MDNQLQVVERDRGSFSSSGLLATRLPRAEQAAGRRHRDGPPTDEAPRAMHTEVAMSTPQPTPTAAEAGNDTSSPNQHHLRGAGARIDYFPEGARPLPAEGPLTLVY